MTRTTRDRVYDFLAPISSESDFLGVVESILREVNNDSMAERSYMMIQDLLEKIEINPKTVSFHKRIMEDQSSLIFNPITEVKDVPEQLNTLLVVGYRRAEKALQLNPEIATNISKNLDQSAKSLENLITEDPTFFDELLFEASLKVVKDEKFAQELREGAESLQTLIPQVEKKLEVLNLEKTKLFKNDSNIDEQNVSNRLAIIPAIIKIIVIIIIIIIIIILTATPAY